MFKKSLFVFVILFSLTINCAEESSYPPFITDIKWGSISVKHNDEIKSYRSAKIWLGKVKEWDRKKTKGTSAIQISDLEEFIDSVDVIILTIGIGKGNKYMVHEKIVDYIKNKDKECLVGKADEMAKIYNTLIQEGKKVGSLFHTTC